MIDLVLPRPVSVNRFMGKLGNQSPKVKEWVRQCDAIYMAVRPRQKIKGEYEIILQFPEIEFGKFDPHNCEKALYDWLQRVEIIENDNLERRGVREWAVIAKGCCRVRVTAWTT